jgi:RNA polymerase sigma factor for flagellar operon FliA
MSDETRLSAAAAEDLWRRWKTIGDVAARDRLILSYAPLVKYIATRTVRRAPGHVSLEDLVSAGLVVLVAAVDGFDPALGASFEQYAWTRVAGGIIDELRRGDWAPRRLRKRAREIETARRDAAERLHRAPTLDELAEVLGTDVAELMSVSSQLERAEVASLHTMVGEGDEGTIELIETVGSSGASPEDAALAQERAGAIRDALGRLSERERSIIQMVFIEGRSGRYVSELIGVSESRVSQVSREIRSKLARELDGYDAIAA